MPKQGFRSITMNNTAVESIESFIKTNRGITIPNYIYSPDQLFSYYLDKKERERKSLVKIANKIKVIPEQVMRYTL